MSDFVHRDPRLEILNHLQNPIWLFDSQQLRHIWTNTVGLAFWEAESLEELASRDRGRTLSEVARVRLAGMCQRVLEKGVSRDVLTFYVNGTATTFHVTSTRYPHITDRVVLLVSVQQAAGAHVSDSLRRSLDAFRYAPGLILLFDLDGQPLLQNAAATLTLGPPRPLAAVLASRSDLTRAQSAVSRGEIFRGELPLARADGTLWCLLALRRILDPATGRPCLLLTAEDTSRARAAEEQAAALQGRAEELIRLNHSLETLVRIASHDLREPLRNISNYTELMLRRLEAHLDVRTTRYAGYISVGVERLEQLVLDLRAFVLVTGGVPSLEPLALSGVLAQVLHNQQVRTEELGATITLGALPTLHGDALLLGQLFENLVDNALKFHRPGEAPVISVRAEETGAAIRVTVEDNGVGIPAAFVERALEPFRRLHTTETEGSGIGLTICREIMRMHSGQITLAPGETGTCVYLTFPTGSSSMKQAPDDDSTH